MKKNTWAIVLISVLAVSTAASVLLAYRYARLINTLQNLQLQMSVINRQRALIQSLANDAVEYSKKNPAIEPILQSVGLRGQPAPAGKPSLR